MKRSTISVSVVSILLLVSLLISGCQQNEVSSRDEKKSITSSAQHPEQKESAIHTSKQNDDKEKGNHQKSSTPSTSTTAPAKDENNVSTPTKQTANVLIKSYLQGLIKGINNGSFKEVKSYLVKGSSLYRDQQSLISHLHGKGIQERLVDYEVVDFKKADSAYDIQTHEVIMIVQSNGSETIKEYDWVYSAVWSGNQLRLKDISKAENTASIKASAQSKQSSGNYDGEWSRDIHHQEAGLIITNSTSGSFDFTIGAAYGAHAGGIEGKAEMEENKAIYKDTEEATECVLNFTLSQKEIKVDATAGCSYYGGLNVSFDGTYKKGKITEHTKTLSELDSLPSEQDENVKKLVGNDYETLVGNFQIVHEEKDLDGLGATALSGGVTGLYTLMEGIIEYDKQGYYYVALIVDSDKVKFYTNNPAYRDRTTLTVKEWMSRFSDYPVETIYKEIKR